MKGQKSYYPKKKQIQLKGIPAASGIVIGKAYVFGTEDIMPVKRHIAEKDIPLEIERFQKALEKTKFYKRFLNPKYGTIIVSRNSSGRFARELEDGTYLFPIGFNQTKLNAILNRLEENKRYES